MYSTIANVNDSAIARLDEVLAIPIIISNHVVIAAIFIVLCVAAHNFYFYFQLYFQVLLPTKLWRSKTIYRIYQSSLFVKPSES